MSDKGREECEGIITGFIERMRHSMGVTMSLSELHKQIEEKYNEKIRQEFDGTFGDQSAGTLQTCLAALNDMIVESQMNQQPESREALAGDKHEPIQPASQARSRKTKVGSR